MTVTNMTAARECDFAVANTATTSRVKNIRMSWGEFCERLNRPTITTETYAEYLAMSRADQDRTKDVGFFVPGHYHNARRKKANLKNRCVVTLDGDFLNEGWELDIQLAYGDLAYAVYTTHKHCPEKPRIRLCILLSDAVGPERYEPIARKLAERMGMDVWDDTTYQYSRVMYWPSHSKDGDYYVEVNEHGRPALPDAVLNEYDDWTDTTQWPTSSRKDKPVRVSAEKADDPLEKRGLVGAFCRAYTIQEAIETFIPDIYEPGVDGRYTYVGGTTSNGAVVYDDRFLYSHHGTDPCSETLVNAFDMVRIHRWGDKDKGKDDLPVTRLPSFLHAIDEFSNRPEIRTEFAADYAKDFEDLGDDEDGESFEENTKWLKQLKYDGNGSVVQNLDNLVLILENDPNLNGAVAFNQFNGSQVFLRSFLGEQVTDTVNGTDWSDVAVARLIRYVQSRYELNLGRQTYYDAIGLASTNNTFHPVKDYLESLEWDGVARLETLFIDYLGCPDDVYHRAVARKMLAAAVARVYEPGRKFDQVCILEGMQGKRKSTFIEALAVHPEWFCDNVGDIRNTKEVAQTLHGKWIIEMPELQAFSKADIEHAKAFFSRQVDDFRPPYGRYNIKKARQFVFFGSTNDHQYLKDSTGNRRFWPIRTHVEGMIDVEKLKENIDQIWAEALLTYNKGEPLWMADPEEERLAVAMQEGRMVTIDIEGQIEEWLNEPKPTNFRSAKGSFQDLDSDAPLELIQETCAKEIAVHVLGQRVEDRLKTSDGRDIATVLRKLGWEMADRQKRLGVLGKQRVFERPAQQPDNDWDW